MKLKTYFTTVLIFIAIYSANANANANGYLGNGEISVLQNAYGGWIMSIKGANNNPDGCSKTNIILESTHSQYKEIYSRMALS